MRPQCRPAIRLCFAHGRVQAARLQCWCPWWRTQAWKLIWPGVGRSASWSDRCARGWECSFALFTGAKSCPALSPVCSPAQACTVQVLYAKHLPAHGHAVTSAHPQNESLWTIYTAEVFYLRTQTGLSGLRPSCSVLGMVPGHHSAACEGDGCRGLAPVPEAGPSAMAATARLGPCGSGVQAGVPLHPEEGPGVCACVASLWPPLP